MTTTTTIAPDTDTLSPEQTSTGGWRVRDSQGGRWYPSDEAAIEIYKAGDLEAQMDKVFEIVTQQPERGEWQP